MPETPRSIDRYRFTPSDKLLLDANVWLFIFSPQYRPTDRRAKAYSTALKGMIAARCAIFIDAIVLSEFVNVLARLAYNSVPMAKRPSDFKAFRNSSSFKPIAKSIADSCRRVLEIAKPIEGGFTSLDTTDLLRQYESSRSDLNDLLLAHLCRTQVLTLVTDDADFAGSGLAILTANAKLLR
ncbi:MAG: PIN domain-containing protein [Nitrospira sp. LK70]|nr:PIN domain-containing protein [Nitrospira sp. LK70]